MTDEEYKEKLRKMAEINEELFRMVMEQSRYIREMENMQKVRLIKKA